MSTTSLRPILIAALCTFACGSEKSSQPGTAVSPQEPNGGGGAPSNAFPDSQPPASSGGTELEPGAGGPPQVQFIGRFDTSDSAGPKASWPGARIVTRFHGTAVSVTLSEYAEDWMLGAPSYWDISIDGAAPTVLGMTADNQPRVFELAKDLPAGPHLVELYKRSEMQTGITQFLGFDFHGGTSLPPPPRKKRHIEAMADSYGTGYGIVMLNAPNLVCPGEQHAGKWQNFRLAYPQLLADRFDAEIEGTVYSGKGLTRGIWPTDVDGLIDYYKRSNPNPAQANNAQLFDLKSWPPDVIILAQGTVDNGIGNFRGVYRDFVVDQLRARSPNAHIFLVVPGTVAREKFIDTVKSVEAERAAAGDDKVHAVIPGAEEPEEMTGCGYHGSPVYHQRIANEIGAVIAEKLGW
jgi:hypothetical protein